MQNDNGRNNLNTGLVEASKMLEAALQQMDGIISSAASGGTSSTNSSVSKDMPTSKSGNPMALSERNLISAANVLSTAKTLALALQQVGLAAPAPDAATGAIIADWLDTHLPRQDMDERLRRLQRDKESLALQYQLLADRVSQQTDKIIELEGLLTEKTQQLSAKDEHIQRQMLSRSLLETQKLELMTALSELKLHRTALERENIELKNFGIAMDATAAALKRSPFGSMGNLPQAQTAAGQSPKTPPSIMRHQVQPQYHSLPRVTSNCNNNGKSKQRLNAVHTYDLNANASYELGNDNGSSTMPTTPPLPTQQQQQEQTSKTRNVAFASNEKILIEDNDLMYGSFVSQQSNSTPSPNLRERSSKGLRNIFGKLRRSNSGNLELPALEQADAEFKRGGARATTAGRIEWAPSPSTGSQYNNSGGSSITKAYVDWSPQEVCNWLCDLGLACYEEDCRKWLKANPSICFFSCSPVDIEKELNLKTPLHRKKIQLAIDELTGKEEDELALKAANLDLSWVMRWLDDIGLPQYKDTFLLAKVDGRMLHRLTMEDLAQLHVNSCLHIASLRCGIQCMREMQWHPECLIRRSMTKPTITTTTNDVAQNDAKDLNAIESAADFEEQERESIALWTAHRVMEWLRVADLSEYAPNLRGAGVHGALMLYECRFNADLLADLLSIPPSKTLLRRHLATHFKELLGRSVIQGKREAEAAPGYQPLTISAKVKPPKKTQFSLKRRKSTKNSNGEVDWSDYVCPMNSFTTGCCLGGGSAESGNGKSQQAIATATATTSNSAAT